METSANIDIWEDFADAELVMDRQMKIFRSINPIIVGVVLNKTTYRHFKEKLELKVTGRYFRGGYFCKYVDASIWDGIAIYTRKHQRGAKLFYDLTKLSEYLNGTH